MLKKINPVLLFSIITTTLFVLYEKYIAKIIVKFHIPFVYNTRTIQATVMKYMPLLVLLIIIYILMYFIYKDKTRKSCQ